MRESFLNEEFVRRNFTSRSSNMLSSRRQISEITDEHGQFSPEVTESPQIAVEALQRAEHVVCCWNCDQPGHYWDDCLQDRKIFCYGCGAKETFKPKCQKCLSRKSKNYQLQIPTKEPI